MGGLPGPAGHPPRAGWRWLWWAGGRRGGGAGRSEFGARTRPSKPPTPPFVSPCQLATKAATSAVLSAAGDVIAQTAVDGKPLSAVDWARAGRFATLGAALVGPALHFWYGALGRAVPAPGTGGALARLAADQLLFAPCFIATFFAALLTLEVRGGGVWARAGMEGRCVVDDVRAW